MPSLAAGCKALEPQFALLPADHVRVLHPQGRRGLAAVARRDSTERWIERAIPIADLPEYAAALGGLEDCYVSQQSFYGWRRIAQLAQIGANYIDLDYHRIPRWAGWTAETVADAVLRHLDDASVPAPSYILATGRGLVVVWLHDLLPRGILPRWMAVQRHLAETLKQFGADLRALDAARVFRIAGTANSRVHELVRPVWMAAEPQRLWRWDFEDLAREILPLDRAELVILAARRADRRAQRQEQGQPTRHLTAATYWETVLADLQRLRRHRWFGELPNGQRDAWLLLACNAMSWLAPAGAIRREFYALAQEAGGWNTRECESRMASVFRRAELAAAGVSMTWNGQPVDPRYRFRADTIIGWLEITQAEMREAGLRVLIDGDVRRENERARWHDRREAAGGLDRATWLAENNTSRQKPWEALGMSRATWYRRGCPTA